MNWEAQARKGAKGEQILKSSVELSTKLLVTTLIVSKCLVRTESLIDEETTFYIL